MPVWVPCPHCDQHYQFPDATAGKQASCPKCGQVLRVPVPDQAPMAVPIPPAPRLPPPEPQRIPRGPDLPPAPDEPMWALPAGPERPRPVPPRFDDRRLPPRPRPFDDRRPLRPIPVAAAPPPAPSPPPPVASPETLDPNLPAVAGDNPTAYHHPACGGHTTFSADVAARISGDPFSFTAPVYCANCRRYVGLRSVVWQGTRETLAAYRTRLRRQMHPGKILMRVVGGPLIGILLGAALGFFCNPNGGLLGTVAGVVIGLPLGYFITGVAYQIGWAMAQKKKAAAGGS